MNRCREIWKAVEKLLVLPGLRKTTLVTADVSFILNIAHPLKQWFLLLLLLLLFVGSSSSSSSVPSLLHVCVCMCVCVCVCVCVCDVVVGWFGVFCFVLFFLFLLSSYQQLGFEAKVKMAGMTKPIAWPESQSAANRFRVLLWICIMVCPDTYCLYQFWLPALVESWISVQGNHNTTDSGIARSRYNGYPL